MATSVKATKLDRLVADQYPEVFNRTANPNEYLCKICKTYITAKSNYQFQAHCRTRKHIDEVRWFNAGQHTKNLTELLQKVLAN